MKDNILSKNNFLDQNKPFRSVEFWKSAVITMPDNSFFELMRSVFGKIKTPFRKHQLINDLETFLLREDIKKTITAYIDDNDAKVITAVAVFGEPVTEELESFFSGEFSFAQLQDIIVNLEERFILYRFNEEKASRIALNPVLKPVLSPFAADMSILFPSVSVLKDSAVKNTAADASINSSAPLPAAAVLDDRILAGLLSFVSGSELFFRAEGVIRKRVIEAGKTCFPGIDLSLVLGSLQILGLFYADGERLIPDKERFNDLGLLSVRERMEYCAAAIFIYKESKIPSEKILPPLYRSRIRETTNLIHGFLDHLETGIPYHEKSLRRLMEILKAKTGVNCISRIMFEALEKTGLLVTVLPQVMQHGAAARTESSGSCIAIDSGFTVLVYPEISYTDVISLASIMNIKETGAVVRFELDKDSAVRAFNKNIHTDEIIDLLNRLSGDRVDDTMIWTLKDWEKRYGEVSLKKGVVLKLCEDRHYLTKIMPLEGLIIETLAPGLFLLPENAMDEAAAVLHNAGIDIIAHPGSCRWGFSDNERANLFSSTSFPSLNPAFQTNILPAPVNSTVHQPPEYSALTAGFHVILKKLQLGETERAELSARIDRRLVLCEAQLKDAYIRYEKLEARNMDYAGKQNIARQAITQQSPVEIAWSSGGKGERVFGIPKALEKDGGELILVIIPDIPAGKQEEPAAAIKIPLGKISLIRRIKKSIFA